MAEENNIQEEYNYKSNTNIKVTKHRKTLVGKVLKNMFGSNNEDINIPESALEKFITGKMDLHKYSKRELLAFMIQFKENYKQRNTLNDTLANEKIQFLKNEAGVDAVYNKVSTDLKNILCMDIPKKDLNYKFNEILKEIFEKAAYAMPQIKVTEEVNRKVSAFTKSVSSAVDNLYNRDVTANGIQEKKQEIFKEPLGLYAELDLESTIATINAELTPKKAKQLIQSVNSELDKTYNVVVSSLTSLLEKIRREDIRSLLPYISGIAELYSDVSVKTQENPMVYHANDQTKTVSEELSKLNIQYSEIYFNHFMKIQLSSLKELEEQKKRLLKPHSNKNGNTPEVKAIWDSYEPLAKNLLTEVEPINKTITRANQAPFPYGQQISIRINALYQMPDSQESNQ